MLCELISLRTNVDIRCMETGHPLYGEWTSVVLGVDIRCVESGRPLCGEWTSHPLYGEWTSVVWRACHLRGRISSEWLTWP